MALLLPREHGAWGMLLIPFLTAVAITGQFSPPVGVALLTVLLVFLARYPLELMLVPGARLRAGRPDPECLRLSAWVYSVCAAAMALVLILAWNRYWLLPVALVALLFFVFHVWVARRRQERGWAAELLGGGGLTLSALVGWVAATGGLDRTGLLVWLLNCVFFCTGIVYVKCRVRAQLALHRPDLGSPAWVSLWFHLLAVVFVLSLVYLRWASPLVVVPFAAATVRAAWAARRAGRAFALRRLGWSEVALSLFFAGFLTIGFLA